MKFNLCLIFILGMFLSFESKANDFYNLSVTLENGKKLAFSELKGKTVLITNIATKCGFTSQLEDLQKLYLKYKDKSFVIIGMPSNDFGGQNPETGAETAKFCRLKYGVQFFITKKVKVKGDAKHPVFSHISKKRDALVDVMWNFEKFLFNKNGKLIDSFRSVTKPLSSKITSKIEEQL